MSRKRWPPNEAALGVELVKYLEAQGWEVYQEVSLRYGGNRADIVATQNNLLWIIELKTSMGIKLIEQCYNWKRYAHYVSAAIPTRHKRNALTFVTKVFKDYHIGLITIDDPEDYRYANMSNIKEWIPAKLNRKAYTERVTKLLTEEQKTWAKAGNADGNFYTPFQGTSRIVQDMVRKNPGINLKKLVETITHHYASDTTARACISKWVQTGVIPNIRYEREGRSIRFYHDKENKVDERSKTI